MPPVRRSVLAALAAFFVTALVGLWPSAARAVVEVTFYTHEGNAVFFPHAFVTLRGQDDRTGRRIDISYGFTTPHAGPHVLSGPVTGVLESVRPDYLAESSAHFSIPLSAAELQRVIGVAEKWRRLPQPSYELWSQNCIVFVAEIAARLGMAAEVPAELMTQPAGFVDHLAQSNAGWLTARRARFHQD